MTQPLQMGRVRRPRLEEMLLEGSKSPRLTALIAGPGFGKTTLLDQVFSDRNAVWHTITPADCSLSVLARNVVRKLRLVAPRLSAELVTAVEGARGPDVSVDTGRPMAIAASVAHDLDVVLHKDVFLVLDDIHEIEPRSDSANFLAALARLAPPRLRLVAASRQPLPFPVARMLVAAEYSEIDSTDLAFTVSEVADLISARRDVDDAELAKEISQLTGGWPVATVLAVDTAGQEAATLGSELVDRSALFDYLAEEVLAAEDPDVMSSLKATMILPWFDSGLLEHLGIDDSPALSAGSVYVSNAPDVPSARAVAPLVARFLALRHSSDREEVLRLLIAAADWYQDQGHLSEALSCLVRSGKDGAVAAFLTTEGDQLLAAGHTRQVIDVIGGLPEDEVSADLALIDAEAKQLLGDWEGAQDRYRVIVPGEGPIPPALAWRSGFLRHMQGRVSDALDLYSRGQRGTGAARDEALLLGWEASAYWLRGDRNKAKELADGALELARRIDDPRALATAHTVLALVAALDGDRAANDIHYLKALEHAERGRDVVQTIRIRSNRASAFMEEGEFDSALAELDIALGLADMTGFELWRGMALSNRGQVYAYRGRIEEAVADLNEARAAFRRIGSLLESYPVAHLGDVYRLRGDIARARLAYDEAIAMAEAQDDRQILVPAWSGLARLVANKDPDLARELAARATSTDTGIGHAAALVAEGWAAHASGNSEEARSLADESIRIARSRRDLPGLGEALEMMAAVGAGDVDTHLEEAAAIWDQLDVPIAAVRVEIARARRLGGPEGAARARRAAEQAALHAATGLAREARELEGALRREEQPRVVIKTLGGFEVVVAGKSTPHSVWQSRVAREVLWMLIANRGRPLNREVIIERLWPDEDLTKASNRLSVALSTIRKVLDPHGEHGVDHLISDRDSIRLGTDSMLIDIERFMSEAEGGWRELNGGDRSRGLALLAAAEERYAGEFLEEEPYADWAISLREEARTEYLAVVGALAEAAARDGDHDSAARRYLRMVERDPYSEPAHLSLIVAMRRSGRHGSARRLYGNYVARMAELDIEPEAFPDVGFGSDHS